MVADIISLVFHADTEFASVIHEYGIWIYLLIFIILFIEFGVVFLPLTGNSLLFVAGIAAADGSIDLLSLFLVSVVAVYAGYAFSYYTGNYFGLKFLQDRYPSLFDESHITRTTAFFDRYGSEAIIFSHFVPVVRKFAPFMAGIWQMDRKQFVLYNGAGSFVWVTPLVLVGYFAGKLPFFQAILPFLMIIVVVTIVVSLAVSFWMMRRK
jgi:Uncharacterized membrane-associated protein